MQGFPGSGYVPVDRLLERSLHSPRRLHGLAENQDSAKLKVLLSIMMKSPSIVILHQFFYPDDDVSSKHYSQFAEELAKRGWDVTVVSSNRYIRYPKRRIAAKTEYWRSIKIIRCYQPALNQARKWSRLINSIWMSGQWLLALWRMPAADVIIIGTNPTFSALLFLPLKRLGRGRRLVHWVYDLYPEAIIEDGANSVTLFLCKQFQKLMAKAYRHVDLLVDLGSCMRTRLAAYNHGSRAITLTTWAFVEPGRIKEPDQEARQELFNNAKLLLLYSGTMGRAHDYKLFLELARQLYRQDPGIIICFGCRGNRYDELLKAVKPSDKNIAIAPFVPEAQLEKRLVAADIHLLSLRSNWSGVVVPSKFFGSLAVGRPVIYAGPEDSAIAQWIRQFQVGLVLNRENIAEVAERLIYFANHKDKLSGWQRNALEAYQQYFSKKHVMDKWDAVLREIIA